MAAFKGKLHLFVAFDWADEIRLDVANQLRPASLQELERRPRTPVSMAYRPPPLLYPLGHRTLDLCDGIKSMATYEALVFDFGGISISAVVPIDLTEEQLQFLANSLSNSSVHIEAAKQIAASLYKELEPAMSQPSWSSLFEEYYVFQIETIRDDPHQLLSDRRDWLAATIRLDETELSQDELKNALCANISYAKNDLLVIDWTAAILFDTDCEETLQTIEFANLQLLEFRHLDELLNMRLQSAYSVLGIATQKGLPFWRTHSRPLRQLGELRLDINNIFERTSNALKLVGDQYLARVYRLMASKLHLDEWEQSIRSSLEIVNQTYQILSDQAAMMRIEILELIVIALIVIEIALAFTH